LKIKRFTIVKFAYNMTRNLVS